MEHRIVWVHGIGDHLAGYSAPWEQSFNTHLSLAHESYVEVVWETVFDNARRALSRERRGTGAPIRLTQREQLAEAEIREQVKAILAARASAFVEASAPAPTASRSARSAARESIEWSDIQRAGRRRAASDGAASRGAVLDGAAPARGLFDVFSLIDEYIGDFASYLASSRVRAAVQEEAKKILRPFATGDFKVSIVSHSWGTVVAYDALLDLEQEVPDLRIANLFTLGSPLWAVRFFLEDRSGRKPGGLDHWTNVNARGDLIGSWLRPAFDVDQDHQVPAFGDGAAHSSYFVDGNAAVQRDIVASTVLA
jgi:metacaspase-1